MFADKNDHFTTKPISPDERHVVNNLLGRSIERWQLAPRAKRLAASALAYRADDFKRMHFVGAFDFGSKLQGFASIEFDANVSTRCELHGLYVDPIAQGHGVGSALLQHVIDEMLPGTVTSLEARAHRTSKFFFLERDFILVELNGLEPCRIRRSIAPSAQLPKNTKDDVKSYFTRPLINEY